MPHSRAERPARGATSLHSKGGSARWSGRHLSLNPASGARLRLLHSLGNRTLHWTAMGLKWESMGAWNLGEGFLWG